MSAADDHREALEAIAEHLDEAAELVRSLHDARLDAYVLAELEGSQGERGYLGTFARDYIREALAEIEEEPEDVSDAPDAPAGAGHAVEADRG